MNELKAEYDRCGWSTEWGCKQEIDLGDEAAIVLDACSPEDIFDNGHRLFHSACLPSAAVSLARRKLPLVVTVTERRVSVVGAG